MKNKIVALFVALVMAFAMMGTANATSGPKNLKDCDGVYSAAQYPAGFKNVTVQKGGSCILKEGLSVTGGLHVKKGARNVFVHTYIDGNIQAQGVTGTVHVGPESCKYDPPVRNNVMVKDSHNVLICYVHAGNNIKVTGNDGCISVRDSIAENNLTVARNDKFTGRCNLKHRNPAAIRVLRNGYGNHLTVKANSGRPEIVKFNGKYAD